MTTVPGMPTSKSSSGKKSSSANAVKSGVPKAAAEVALHVATTAPAIESAYTLPHLLARVGSATSEEARRLLLVSDADLIAAGKQVATPRISTDCARLYGQALDLLAHATAAQKAALLGVTPNLLRVCVFAAHHGDERYTARQQGLGLTKAQQVSRQTLASETLLRGNGRRDQLRALFLAIVGSEPTWSERIQAAYGTAKTPAELSQALLDLGTIGKELLASRDVGISERRKDSGLTTTLLDEIAKLAKDVKALGGAAQSAREIAPVSQSDVDLWDGLNLLLLEQVMSLFNTAHELEPSIPRLTPLSLRSYFHTSPKKPSQKPAPTPPSA